MVRKPSAENLSEIRRCQRSHAKKRFAERFGFAMNRDRIHEIEVNIANGQVILVESKPQTRNYLAAIDGKLVAVGYNTFTKRVVTALPDAYLTKVPTELIHLAKFRLLEDETGVISDILARQHCQLLYRQSESVAHYIVRYPGFCLKAGYDSHANRLVPYLKQSPLTYPHKMSARERFRIFELDPDVGEQVRRKIRSGESIFLCSYSYAITF